MPAATAIAISVAPTSEDVTTDDMVDVQVPDEPDPGDDGRRSLRGLGALDLFVLGAILLWPCAYLPFFANQAWTPRVMALMVAVPTGMWAVGKLVRHGERAAMWAAAALIWSVISAILSDNVLLSLKGVVSTNSSVLIYAGSIGLWALAHFMSPRARQWVVPTFLIGCGLNLTVGIIQVVSRNESSSIGLVGGRAVGLVGNSMIFGAIIAAGSALCIQRFGAMTGPIRKSWWLAGVFAFSLGTAISGSRVATVAVLVVGMIAVFGCARLRALAAIAVAVLGVLGGTLLDRFAGGNANSLARLSGDAGGRMTAWRVSANAVLEKPVTGWGLGRFHRAVQGRYSLDELVSMPHLPRFGDAHNVVVELLVVLGIPGLILFTGFGLIAMRRCQPALAAAAGAMFVTWLLQPMSYHTLALSFVLLGAGTDIRVSESTPSPPHTSRRPILGVALVALGALPALGLAVADIRFDRAVEASDPVAVRAAADLFVSDPILMYTAGNLAAARAGVDESAAKATLEAFTRSTEIEPGRATWWSELAAAQSSFTDDAATARRTADRAIELDPFNERAWSVVLVTSIELNDDERRLEAAEILCRYDIQPACAQLL